MPSFATTAVVRDSSDGLHITLNARFVFVTGAPSDTIYALKGRVPDNVDVIVQSDLVITLAGSLNRVRVSSRAMQGSVIAQHLLNYFQVNGEQLGLRIASKVFVDQEDGNTKLALSSTRPILDTRPPFVRLCAIELFYACKTPHVTAQSRSLGVQASRQIDSSVAADPFSPHAFLPVVAALDRTLERFVVVHLVRSFPLIFGPWRARFDAEVAVSAKIASAVADIVDRSPSKPFRTRCRRLLKKLRSTTVAEAAGSTNALRTSLPECGGQEIEETDGGVLAPLDYHLLLGQAIERVIKHGLKPVQYKSAVSRAAVQELTTGRAHHDDHLSLPHLTFESPNHSLDAWSAVELCFDEDTETHNGREELLGDDDLWVPDAAESRLAASPPMDEFDDLWDSSQSTLDDSLWDSEQGAPLEASSSHCQDDGFFTTGSSPIGWEGICASDESDGWLDGLTHTTVPIESYSRRCSSALSMTSCSELQCPTDPLPTFMPLALVDNLTTPACDLSSEAPSRTVNEALESVSPTSYLPILMHDDLACDMAIDNSGAFFTATGSPSPSFASIGEGSDLEIECELSAQRSSDGNTLSSRPASLEPWQRTTVSNSPRAPVGTLPLLRELACSDGLPSLGASRRRNIDGDGWNSHCQGSPASGCQGRAHEGNEGSLVAEDLWHATAIRSSPEETASVEEGTTGRFLSELVFVDSGGMRWGGEVDCEANDVLFFE